MKKYGWIILLVVSTVIGGMAYFYSSNSKPNSDYSAERSSLNNVDNLTVSDNNTSNSSLNSISTPAPQTTVEKELTSFSTKIQNQKDSNRQGNITITCSALNNTIVKAR